MNERFAALPPGVYDALSHRRVLIAGAGGLGSNAAMLLVRSGVGILEIFDFDLVSASNLNRQFYFSDQIGRKKVAALRDNLLRINPAAGLRISDEELTATNCPDLLNRPVEVVLECFDEPESKALLVNYLLRERPELPVIAVSGVAGVGATEMPVRRGPGRLYLIGDGESDAESDGTLASRVMLAAATQAQLAVQLLLQLDLEQR